MISDLGASFHMTSLYILHSFNEEKKMLERKAALNGFKILLNLQGGNLVFDQGKL